VSGSVLQYVSLLLYALPGLIIGFVLHELAHAYTAVRLGDPTPRRMGRLTLSPREHIDPVGFGLLVTVGFGWAKPVTFSTAYIRTAAQQALVAAAGPLTNLVLAVVFGLLIRLELLVAGPDLLFGVANDAFANGYLTFGHGGAAAVLYLFLIEAFFINLVLFSFNSIPLPPLDGYAVARGLLGHVIPFVFDFIDRNRQLVFFAAILILVVLPLSSGGASSPLWTFIEHTNHSLFTSVVGTSPYINADLPRIWMLFPSTGP
jgi:Zn-dependent protease